MFATRPCRKFTDDHRAFEGVLPRPMKGADPTKIVTRNYTSPWDMTYAAQAHTIVGRHKWGAMGVFSLQSTLMALANRVDCQLTIYNNTRISGSYGLCRRKPCKLSAA